jgi:hypothetical protein
MKPPRDVRTNLRRRRREVDPMAEYDRLPPPVRAWLAGARLPWSPRSAARAFATALRETRDPQAALAALDALESRRLAHDAAGIWGGHHPSATAIEAPCSPASFL